MAMSDRPVCIALIAALALLASGCGDAKTREFEALCRESGQTVKACSCRGEMFAKLSDKSQEAVLEFTDRMVNYPGSLTVAYTKKLESQFSPDDARLFAQAGLTCGG
ncbi:hypothetical protein [Stakelama tenebrarum]|uniref:Lipoprotein n=1 Tax=Stakelama tenebrarum TaxID=2711215 RepID=A0A6G6Y3X7_9SPHN|nr:hypothetical protein [Sphingosinithalassobacter tenebrarum]QIG79632.1 hypothetical protein G5C33_07400 [Sphingosinithalassobacter tenebrarum]